MARQIKIRSIGLSDETFDGLKMAAAVKRISISKIIENLAREYLTANAEEIKISLQKKIALVENPN